ncbi:hypothetical protein BJV74DRAFT_807685 [Russula compacta]|nr:hypothetical protein BJV74DRAFT_807685 [Russula compacta]
MSSKTATDMADLVQEWLRIDQNPGTKREISDLWAAGHTEELRKRLSSRIEFGTAGLRGRMEAGWSRMNDLIVIQASQVRENVLVWQSSGARRQRSGSRSGHRI